MNPILASIGHAVIEPDVVRTNALAVGAVAASALMSRIDVVVQVLILAASLVYTLGKAASAIITTVRLARTAGEILPHSPRSTILPECSNIDQCPLLLAAREVKVDSLRRSQPKRKRR